MLARTGHRGFTLVELIIVIVIILILVGLLVPTIHLLRRSQFRTVTAKTMEGLTWALTMYIDDYASLGFASDSSDFVAAPLTFLHANRIDAGLKPYFEPGPHQRIQVTDPIAERVRTIADPAPGGSATIVTQGRKDGTPRECTHITDGFGKNIVRFKILNGQLGSRYFPRVVELRSEAGTANTEVDDIIWIMVLGKTDVIFDGRTYPGTDADWRSVKEHELD